MTEPAASAVEQARTAWRRAVEETQVSLAAAREQAESELRRRWAQLRDAVDQALASGMSQDEVGRRLGLPPGLLDALLGRDAPLSGLA